MGEGRVEGRTCGQDDAGCVVWDEGQLLDRLHVVAEGEGRSPRLGVMGGTFDPIHLGHVETGLFLRDELSLDGVLFMPAGVPSFKRDLRLATEPQRLEMTRLAVAGLERCAVSAREVERPGITYTADTLVELARACPEGTRLFFAMGADSLETLPLWHRAADIARLATIVVARRTGHDVGRALDALGGSGLGFDVRVLSGAVRDVSSTQVRALVSRGVPVDDLVGPAVAGYIAREGLYHTSRG